MRQYIIERIAKTRGTTAVMVDDTSLLIDAEDAATACVQSLRASSKVLLTGFGARRPMRSILLVNWNRLAVDQSTLRRSPIVVRASAGREIDLHRRDMFPVTT